MPRRDDSEKLDAAKAREDNTRKAKLPKMTRAAAEKITGRLDDDTYVDRMMNGRNN